MRKINPTLQGQGFSSFKDLLSRPSNVITVGPDKCDYTSPLNAANAAQSGDLILVYPDTYDLGNNTIQLKNDVDWQFLSGVTINSDSIDGTFNDGGVPISINFEGNPTVNNSNGFHKAIVKVVNSTIKGYLKRYRALLLPDITPPFGDFVFEVYVLENNIGDIVWSKAAQGSYRATLTGAFNYTKSALYLPNSFGSASGTYRLLFNGGTDGNQFRVICTDTNFTKVDYSDSAAGDAMPPFPVEIVVVP